MKFLDSEQVGAKYEKIEHLLQSLGQNLVIDLALVRTNPPITHLDIKSNLLVLTLAVQSIGGLLSDIQPHWEYITSQRVEMDDEHLRHVLSKLKMRQ